MPEFLIIVDECQQSLPSGPIFLKTEENTLEINFNWKCYGPINFSLTVVWQ